MPSAGLLPTECLDGGGCGSATVKTRPTRPPRDVACRAPYPGLEYTEIRITSQNWESAFFIAWLQQIIPSGLLGAPAGALGPGEADKKVSFRDERNALDYGHAFLVDGLEMATQVQDCRLVTGDDTRAPCAHVVRQ